MKLSVALTFLVVCLLLVSAEGRRNGKRRGGRGMAAKKRVWHVAEDKEQCGNYTKLMEEEKPTDLCTEENTQVCICATKDDLSTGNAVWQFRCGSCDLKWRPVKDEAQKEKRKSVAQEKKKRRMERMKMRRKLNRKSAKAEKARKRKNNNKNKGQDPE
eukprot:TRINITY_DN8504_c0_g1_i1.p2 TRINITY_DN8504_c0_g1~~TRINITY_DN8504_c0_g1_i1.p2  ORF type:complete len:158 (-),score=58.29 TRINITY_DN8504_c0_g1_i1:92-565(-)